MFTKAMVLAVSCSALAFGCGADQRDGAGETQEIIDNLVQAGYPAGDIAVVDGVVYVQNDAAVSLEASREMIATDFTAGDKEQYRTTNLVGTGVTNICINGSAYTGAFNAPLNSAIANYNNLGLRWHMTRTTGGTAGCNATILMRLSGPVGGSSGFPSGGLPFNTVNVGSGLSTFAASTITHVITHELGHCVGFRHSDFFNRAISCGGAASNEGQAGVGAILIPGTPSGATVGGSVMNACFRTTETGRFTNTDVTALNALY